MVEHHHDSCNNCGRPFDHEILDEVSCILNECWSCTMIDEDASYRRAKAFKKLRSESGEWPCPHGYLMWQNACTTCRQERLGIDPVTNKKIPGFTSVIDGGTPEGISMEDVLGMGFNLKKEKPPKAAPTFRTGKKAKDEIKFLEDLLKLKDDREEKK